MRTLCTPIPTRTHTQPNPIRPFYQLFPVTSAKLNHACPRPQPGHPSPATSPPSIQQQQEATPFSLGTVLRDNHGYPSCEVESRMLASPNPQPTSPPPPILSPTPHHSPNKHNRPRPSPSAPCFATFTVTPAARSNHAWPPSSFYSRSGRRGPPSPSTAAAAIGSRRCRRWRIGPSCGRARMNR